MMMSIFSAPLPPFYVQAQLFHKLFFIFIFHPVPYIVCMFRARILFNKKSNTEKRFSSIFLFGHSLFYIGVKTWACCPSILLSYNDHPQNVCHHTAYVNSIIRKNFYRLLMVMFNCGISHSNLLESCSLTSS